jgi:hypothetical protein
MFSVEIKADDLDESEKMALAKILDLVNDINDINDNTRTSQFKDYSMFSFELNKEQE